MTTIANSVACINSLNGEGGVGNHLHRVNTNGFAIDTGLLDQHAVFLIFTGIGLRNMVTCCGSSTSDSGRRVGIAVPVVKDTRSELVTDIGGQRNICTCANRILVVRDLHIDGVIDIYIVRFARHGATGGGVGHHESELIGVGTGGEHCVNAGGVALERSIGFSPFVIVAIEIVVNVSSQLDSIIQAHHRGTGNFNSRHRTHIDRIEDHRVGNAAADALCHSDRIDVSCFDIVFAIKSFCED